MRETTISFLLIIFSLYVLICALFYIFQDKFIFFPTKLNESFSNLKEYEKDEIIIKHKNISLHGWLLNPDKSNLILYYGGNGEEVSGNLDDFKIFEDYSILLLNYRGYGKSEGSPGQKELFSDALYTYDYILNKSESKINRIIVFGRSLGTGIAIYIASRRPVDGIILVTPYDSIKNLAKRYFPFLPVKLILKHPFDSMNYVENLNVPTLVLVAENDEVIPYENTKILIDKLGINCKSVIIKNSGHNDIQLFSSYWEEINSFLK
ncbi:MAG: alpha/beta hydrolase [Calditrichaeota bacterium]|nr:alpha/beta hydrolase [Calditrichota bacterium]